MAQKSNNENFIEKIESNEKNFNDSVKAIDVALIDENKIRILDNNNETTLVIETTCEKTENKNKEKNKKAKLKNSMLSCLSCSGVPKNSEEDSKQIKPTKTKNGKSNIKLISMKKLTDEADKNSKLLISLDTKDSDIQIIDSSSIFTIDLYKPKENKSISIEVEKELEDNIELSNDAKNLIKEAITESELANDTINECFDSTNFISLDTEEIKNEAKHLQQNEAEYCKKIDDGSIEKLTINQIIIPKSTENLKLINNIILENEDTREINECTTVSNSIKQNEVLELNLHDFPNLDFSVVDSVINKIANATKISRSSIQTQKKTSSNLKERTEINIMVEKQIKIEEDVNLVINKIDSPTKNKRLETDNSRDQPTITNEQVGICIEKKSEQSEPVFEEIKAEAQIETPEIFIKNENIEISSQNLIKIDRIPDVVKLPEHDKSIVLNKVIAEPVIETQTKIEPVVSIVTPEQPAINKKKEKKAKKGSGSTISCFSCKSKKNKKQIDEIETDIKAVEPLINVAVIKFENVVNDDTTPKPIIENKIEFTGLDRSSNNDILASPDKIIKTVNEENINKNIENETGSEQLVLLTTKTIEEVLIKTEPVTVEANAETISEEIQIVPVSTEIIVEPVLEGIKSEPVFEEIKAEAQIETPEIFIKNENIEISSQNLIKIDRIPDVVKLPEHDKSIVLNKVIAEPVIETQTKIEPVVSIVTPEQPAINKKKEKKAKKGSGSTISCFSCKSKKNKKQIDEIETDIKAVEPLINVAVIKFENVVNDDMPDQTLPKSDFEKVSSKVIYQCSDSKFSNIKSFITLSEHSLFNTNTDFKSQELFGQLEKDFQTNISADDFKESVVYHMQDTNTSVYKKPLQTTTSSLDVPLINIFVPKNKKTKSKVQEVKTKHVEVNSLSQNVIEILCESSKSQEKISLSPGTVPFESSYNCFNGQNPLLNAKELNNRLEILKEKNILNSSEFSENTKISITRPLSIDNESAFEKSYLNDSVNHIEYKNIHIFNNNLLIQEQFNKSELAIHNSEINAQEELEKKITDFNQELVEEISEQKKLLSLSKSSITNNTQIEEIQTEIPDLLKKNANMETECQNFIKINRIPDVLNLPEHDKSVVLNKEIVEPIVGYQMKVEPVVLISSEEPPSEYKKKEKKNNCSACFSCTSKNDLKVTDVNHTQSFFENQHVSSAATELKTPFLKFTENNCSSFYPSTVNVSDPIIENKSFFNIELSSTAGNENINVLTSPSNTDVTKKLLQDIPKSDDGTNTTKECKSPESNTKHVDIIKPKKSFLFNCLKPKLSKPTQNNQNESFYQSPSSKTLFFLLVIRDIFGMLLLMFFFIRFFIRIRVVSLRLRLRLRQIAIAQMASDYGLVL